jgi:hypothetical protein
MRASFWLLPIAASLVACAAANNVSPPDGGAAGGAAPDGGLPTGGAHTGGGGAHTGGAPPGDDGGVPCTGTLDQTGCSCPQVGATRACFTGPAGAQNKGTCRDGSQTCVQSGEFGVWGPCTGDVLPAAEVCGDALDHNCNGLTGCDDPACAGLAGCCKAGDTRPCYSGPQGTQNVGPCHGGTQTCDMKGAWLPCAGEVLPAVEIGHCADGLDNDCNGAPDCFDFLCLFDPVCAPKLCTAGDTQPCYDGPAGSAGVGPCHGGTKTCAADGKSWSACAGQVVPGAEGGHCGDGVDNDCNGKTDCVDPACATAAACCTPSTGSADGTIYANSSDKLYRVDPATFAVTQVGSFNCGDQITDLALTPNGNLYAVSFTTLYSVNKATGAATRIADVGGSGNNSLTFLPNGTLLAADSSGWAKIINPVSGAVTSVGNYGNNYTSSGDLVAVKDGTMYGTSPGSGSDVLLRVDVATGVATLVGPTGYASVWGLAYAQKSVIGFTTGGQILRIDPQTGAATQVASPGISFWGATQSPLVEGNACP